MLQWLLSNFYSFLVTDTSFSRVVKVQLVMKLAMVKYKFVIVLFNYL